MMTAMHMQVHEQAGHGCSNQSGGDRIQGTLCSRQLQTCACAHAAVTCQRRPHAPTSKAAPRHPP
jgi:hypothetical protein